MDVDYPAGSMSPTLKQPAPNGWQLTWQFKDLVTGQHIALDLPNPLNPGPMAARLTAFAPVSLLFFLIVMVILGVLSDTQSPSGELRLSVRRVLRLPPAAGLSRRSHLDSRGVLHLVDRQRVLWS